MYEVLDSDGQRVRIYVSRPGIRYYNNQNKIRQVSLDSNGEVTIYYENGTKMIRVFWGFSIPRIVGVLIYWRELLSVPLTIDCKPAGTLGEINTR